MPASRKVADSSSEPELPAAADGTKQTAEGEERYVLLEYLGATQVFAPFGELHYGEVVASPVNMVKGFMATDLFHEFGGEPGREEIRHP